MGKKSSSGPDVVGAAETEGAYSRETARDTTYADRADQSNPFGSVNWTTEQVIDPATGEPVTKWNQNTTIDPRIQYQLNNELGMMGSRSDLAAGMDDRVAAEMGTAPDWGQFGEAQDGPVAGGPVGTNVGPIDSGYSGYVDEVNSGRSGVSGVDQSGGGVGQTATGATMQADGKRGEFSWDSNNRARAEAAYLKKDTDRMDPRFQAEREATDIRLRGQGLNPGDQSYEAQMGQFNTQKNDAYERARLSAVEGGMREDQQSFGQALGGYDANQRNDMNFSQRGLDTAASNRASAQQVFDQQFSSRQQQIDKDQQNFEQSMSADEFARLDDQQTYEQRLASGEDQRAGDQQYFDQTLDSAGNLQTADAQWFDQQSQATDRANALRAGDIEEYLGKRNFSASEQDRLRQGQTVGDISAMVQGN